MQPALSNCAQAAKMGPLCIPKLQKTFAAGQLKDKITYKECCIQANTSTGHVVHNLLIPLHVHFNVAGMPSQKVYSTSVAKLKPVVTMLPSAKRRR